MLFLMISTTSAFAQPLRVVALGDSLTAGYGLPAADSFPQQLQRALVARGFSVTVENAGVSGDTSAGGLSRLARSIAGNPKPDLVLVELGANDMLRGVPPNVTKNNLHQILATLKQQNIPALLCGMVAPPYFPGPFVQSFNAIYPDLAEEFDVPLYDFFLEGIVFDSHYNLPDGVHPNAKGIAVIVDNITPTVEKALNKAVGKSSWNPFK